jgi:hypothetical protein
VAGNCAIGTVDLSIDTRAPLVEVTYDREPDSGVWWTGPVTVSFPASDPEPGSGLTADPPDPLTVTADGVTAVASGNVCDLAGNCAEATGEVWIDSEAPVMGDPSLSPSYIRKRSSTVLTVDVSDALSGVAGVEYFIDSDPGVGNGVPMALNGGSASASLGSDLDVGVYEVYVRAVDLTGHWAEPKSVLLTVYRGRCKSCP